MAEDDFLEPHLTRGESKFIRLLRMQSEKRRQEITEIINRLYDERKESSADIPDNGKVGDVRHDPASDTAD